MRPVRFFIALLLGLVIFSFAAKLLFMVLIGLAGLALVTFVAKGLFRLIMTVGSGYDRGYYGYPQERMGRNRRYNEALPIDPYADSRSELYVAHRTIEIL